MNGGPAWLGERRGHRKRGEIYVVAPYTAKCFLKVKEDGVKICVISQGFFDLKVKVCDSLKSIAAFTEAVLKGR